MFLVGLAVGELVSAYPLSGGVYQIISRITKLPWLAWQSGWWLVIAHTVATAAVGVSQMHVSRLLSSSLQKLREGIGQTEAGRR